MTQPQEVRIDELLAQVDDEIAQAAAHVNLLDLVRLAELQGQRAGIVRAVRFSQQAQAVRPAAPAPVEHLDEQVETIVHRFPAEQVARDNHKRKR